MRIGIIGSGNLGRAFAHGLGEPVLVSDALFDRAQVLAAEVGGEAVADNAELARRAEIIVLCHKPAQLSEVAWQIGGAARGVLSFIGATTLEQLHEAYGTTPLVRAMPNTALEVGEALIVVADPAPEDAALHAEVLPLLAEVGKVVGLPESLMMLTQASSGAMPAYVALFAEAQIDALIRRGLPADTAAELVISSIPGAARLIAAHGNDTLAVRRAVTSPGGTTAKGLAALEAAGLRTAFDDAIDSILGAPR